MPDFVRRDVDRVRRSPTAPWPTPSRHYDGAADKAGAYVDVAKGGARLVAPVHTDTSPGARPRRMPPWPA